MRIGAAELERMVGRIFEAAGCAAGEAACVARHLVDSNLCGHDSHGVIRVPRYVGFVRAGTVVPGAVPEVVAEGPGFLVLDGGMGFGQVVGEVAMTRLAPKAKAQGIALAGVRNVGHLGRLGDWAEQLAREGLVSLHFLNTTGKGMAAVPFGGSDRRLSLNPLSIAAPLPGRPPLLLDMTTTVVAEGKLAVARNKGEQVAPGTIVDRHGNPTTDPVDFYDGGALLPIAGHKGSGLNVMVDVLAGALSGGGCTRPGVDVLVNTMASIAIEPALIGDPEWLAAEVARYAGHVKASPPRLPGGEVLLPGEVEHRTRAERGRNGIPLDETTRAQLIEAAESVGLSREAVAPLG
jgi:hydroxycarboxylate dehydrogenase B